MTRQRLQALAYVGIMLAQGYRAWRLRQPRCPDGIVVLYDHDGSAVMREWRYRRGIMGA